MDDNSTSKAAANDIAPSTYVDTNGLRVGAWDATFCGCCTHVIPNCCMVTLLPFISVAQITHRIGIARYSVVLLSFLAFYVFDKIFMLTIFLPEAKKVAFDTTGSTISDENAQVVEVLGAISCLVSIVYYVALWHLRGRIREQFQIPGSCCCDCCAVFWCSCCSIAQMATQVKSYNKGSCDFGPRDTLPAYR